MLVYFTVCFILSITALVLAQCGSFIIVTASGEKKQSAEKLLTTVAGIVMVIYGLILLKEWLLTSDEGSDDQGRKAAVLDASRDGVHGEEDHAHSGDDASGSDSRGTGHSGPDPLLVEDGDVGDGSKRKETQYTMRTLVVVSFFGSLDTLALFVPMIVGRAVYMLELFIGTFLAASTIVALSLFLGRCTPLSRLLEALPTPIVVLAYGAIILVKGYAMSRR